MDHCNVLWEICSSDHVDPKYEKLQGLVPTNCFNFQIYVLIQYHPTHPGLPMVTPFEPSYSTHIASSEFFLSKGPDLMRALVPPEMSDDSLCSITQEVMSFTRQMLDNHRHSNPNNVVPRILPLGLHFVLSMPYDEGSTDVMNYIMRESMEEVKLFPASETAIEAMKKVKIEDCGGKECSICLEEFKEGMEISGMPCDHVYHDECITKWLRKSSMCPLCRCSMPVDDLLD